MKRKEKKSVVTVLPRPPVVVVVGHVDHGKTTLLDSIRKKNVVATESGGITQHISAYKIEFISGINKKKNTITFIDTPGHESFVQMRSRGAKVADVAVLVVAANDSVKPQTIESIEQIKKADLSMIVVINKIDLSSANVEKVKKDLAKSGVQIEGYGGDIPCVLVSAKQSTGIDELLEMIILVSSFQNLEKNHNQPFCGVVVETKLDKGKGITAVVIVKKGILTKGMDLYEESVKCGKIRALFGENEPVLQAMPGEPVEIVGFTKHPQVGSILSQIPKKPDTAVLKNEKEQKKDDELPDFLKPIDEAEKMYLNVILKADTSGTIEAIEASLDERIKLVRKGVGDISENDILEAKSTGSFVIGFNTKINSKVMSLAAQEKVIVRTYKVIYELLDEIKEVAQGIKEIVTKEKELGEGKIIAEFPFDDSRIAGVKVVSGRIARGDTVKIIRDGTELFQSSIKSIRQEKSVINKVESGAECGILFDKDVDFQVNDDIIAITQIK